MLIGSKKKNGDTRYMSIPGSNQFKRTLALASRWVDLATRMQLSGVTVRVYCVPRREMSCVV
uniref:Uncharacterized protein n=1 Tax=Anguilla anguilla TaxID=7936 RepID=A0A0E9X980_ANGAN